MKPGGGAERLSAEDPTRTEAEPCLPAEEGSRGEVGVGDEGGSEAEEVPDYLQGGEWEEGYSVEDSDEEHDLPRCGVPPGVAF